MKGFFSRSALTVVNQPTVMIPKCGACGLLHSCRTPKMPHSGRGRRRVLIVGEAPGEYEDKHGEPFVGKSGQFLHRHLEELDVNPERDCWFYNSLACRPPGNKVKNKKWIEYCRPNVLNKIEELKPDIIILLGLTAVKSLIGYVWKENVGEMARWLGWKIPLQKYNCWVCPTWHPSFLLRREDDLMDRFFAQHLKAAFELEGKPWGDAPDYKDRVTVIYDQDTAADIIRTMSKGDRAVAYDYETNMLKPDSPKGYVKCCSLSDGKLTIAFPWTGRPVAAMKEFVRSKVRKIASNMKFEDRWTRAKLGLETRNWYHCTMTGAHILDNRPGITSIKFQSFALLGQEVYNAHVEPFLKSKEQGGYEENNVRNCGMGELMTYCGLDSLLEWEVAKRQRKELG